MYVDAGKETNNRFVASWKDENGIRRRKRFPTRIAASRFEHSQQAIATAAVLRQQLDKSQHWTRRGKGKERKKLEQAAIEIITRRA